MPRPKYFRHRAEGEIFLLTSPFIGLGDQAVSISRHRPLDAGYIGGDKGMYQQESAILNSAASLEGSHTG